MESEFKIGDRVYWTEGRNEGRHYGTIKRLSDPPRWATVTWMHSSGTFEMFQLVSTQKLRQEMR